MGKNGSDLDVAQSRPPTVGGFNLKIHCFLIRLMDSKIYYKLPLTVFLLEYRQAITRFVMDKT